MKKTTIGLLVIISPLSSAQTCNINSTRTVPDSRYELLNNGTEVKDIQTNLIWQRCSLGQIWSGTVCTGTAATYNWTNALQTAKNMGNGWRVPSIKELDSLVEEACFKAAINETYFPATQNDFYWSSSPTVSSRYYAWSVYFVSGFDGYDDKNNSLFVRLVRSSQ